MRDAAPSGEGAATPAASNSRLTRAPAVANHDASRDLLLLAEHTGAEASLKAELERTCVAGSPPIASHSLILHGLSPFRVIALEAASAEALTVATALAGEKRAYSRPTRITAHVVAANTPLTGHNPHSSIRRSLGRRCVCCRSEHPPLPITLLTVFPRHGTTRRNAA